MPSYKTYQTFDEYAVDQSAVQRAIIEGLRQFIAQTVPELVESSKWGRGCWLKGDLPFVFVNAESDYVQLGFYGGTLMDDPAHILEGGAKFIRHVKIRSPEDIDPETLGPLVSQAAVTKYK